MCGIAPKNSANDDLVKQGYKNILDDPNYGGKFESPMDAPVGAVIVYGVTDGSPYGHIEVRITHQDKPAVASDYISDHARTETSKEDKSMIGRNRKVIGIWVKG